MSVRLPPSSQFSYRETDDDLEEGSEGSETGSEDEDDQNWDDWVSDSLSKQPCRSLFEDKMFPSADEALQHDKAVHGFDLEETCTRLSLDSYGRIRLINYIRKTNPKPSDVSALMGEEPFFHSDEYLVPSLENDPLLQIQSYDWSDDEEEGPSQSMNPERRIRALEQKLELARQDFAEYRSLVNTKLDIAGLVETVKEPESAEKEAGARDDDTHYFDSYAENDIHAVMIQDKVRTSTYAQFILTNPGLFRDAIVLDVGCGTGILSLFAARAGAKRVIAVDASRIAERAERIVKANGLEDVITVVRGKVEDIALPEGVDKVDVIVSEWMGYGLLYESMLDSVLHARDRFLKPEGVMVPSQCKMMLCLCDGSEIFKERIGFWSDIYGFDLSIMAEGVHDDAIIDVVGPDQTLSEPYPIKDLLLNEIKPRQLDFTSSFKLVATAGRRAKVHCLVLYFDTFFTINGHPVPPGTSVKPTNDRDVVLAEVWPVGGKPATQRRKSLGPDRDTVTSFSTGPKSTPTHWKQTLFLLREPIPVSEGTVVQGTFHCRKSNDNSRELDVEIHYSVQQEGDKAPGDVIVQMYKVR